uniref:NADH-ubiquinone oxidoreductase chain 6 n=1 Tax=Chamberlainia hainesiana TaxID=1264661 RepID=A0A513X096_9BIVA|nr:NADH dehydrogenase subunit 6 [Chamberlainia hainesiana]QDH07355.1 NADH dehydrogenase subunit 6 [Chamberlainia hainesiana]
MTLLMLSSLWVYLSLLMATPMHPLSTGMMLLFLAFINCVLIATLSPWYAYMLFFIFIGGVLVMFAYIASLSPNSKFSLNNQLVTITLTIVSMCCLTGMNSAKSHQMNTEFKLATNNMTETLGSLYFQNSTSCVLLLACALLLTMVASVKLCSPKNGALRPFR